MYSLYVLSIPDVKLIVDEADAVVFEIKKAFKKSQPVLVGTTSIEKSELLSNMLKKERIKHQVLNARYHEEEAYIIANAGIPGAVTIATNMAGRGTDIQLGGNADMIFDQRKEKNKEDVSLLKQKINEEVEISKKIVKDAGGLYVLATERHESRRIDNQLRGRSGRQGDPGRTSFFLSLEDDLMRIFGSDKLDSMLKRLGMKEGESIAHPWVNKALERAQSKVEARNFDIRKNLLKYDDVMNLQRKSIFNQRREIMEAETVSETIIEMREKVIENIVLDNVENENDPMQWDSDLLKTKILEKLGLNLPLDSWVNEDNFSGEELLDRINIEASKTLDEKVNKYGVEIIQNIEKQILLQTIDKSWREHLLKLEHLRSVIGFRGYAQRDPLNEYKSEAYELFEVLLQNIGEEVTKFMAFFQLVENSTVSNNTIKSDNIEKSKALEKNKSEILQNTVPANWGKVGRNSPCPCGSGKKFKNCHGRN